MNFIEKIKGANLQQVRLFMFALFAVVLPFSGLHVTSELYEYDTFFVLAVYSLIALTLLVAQILFSKRIVITWSIVDSLIFIGLVLLGIVQYVTHASGLSFFGGVALSTTSYLAFVAYALVYFTCKDVVSLISLQTIAKFVASITSLTLLLAVTGIYIDSLPRFYPTAVSTLIMYALLSIVSMLYLISLNPSRLSKIVYGVWTALVLTALIISQASFALILALVIGGIGALLVSALYSTKNSQRMVALTTGILILLTVAIYVPFGKLIGVPQIMDATLPHFAGLEITKDTLATQSFFGVGLQEFGEAFYKYKPFNLGQTVFAFSDFTRSSSVLFELLTTGGVVTTLMWYAPLLVVIVLFLIHLFRLRVAQEPNDILIKNHYLYTFSIGIIFLLGSLVYMFDVTSMTYVMIFFAISYPLLANHTVITKELSQVISTGFLYIGIVAIITISMAGVKRAIAYENYFTSVSEGIPLTESTYLTLQEDPYVAITYSAHQIQSVNEDISQEEKEKNVRSGITALQKVFVTYSNNFVILTILDQINTMYQQVVGDYPINHDELGILLNDTYPSNPSTRYQKSLTALQSLNVVSTEGEVVRTTKITPEQVAEIKTSLESLTNEYPTLTQAHLLMAYLLTASGDIVNAEQSYLKVLVQDSINKSAVIGLAHNLIEQDKKADALQLLETYQKDNAEDVEIKELLMWLSTKD